MPELLELEIFQDGDNLEESKEIRDNEYTQFVQIAKDLGMYVQE